MTDLKSKKIKKMGFGLISAGFIFFFLPDFTVIDLLPDIIGYVLISAGLTRLADMYDEFSETKKMFNRLILLGAAKFLGIFITYMFNNGNELPTTILTVIFVLAVAECFLLIPAYLKLFDALVHAATRLDGQAIFVGPKKKTGYVDKVKRSTVRFVILKNLLWVLPETSALAVTDGFQAYNYSKYDFVNHYRFLSMVAILILGIIWVIKIRKYFSSIKKDTEFIERLTEKYETEILPDPSIFARRRLDLALSVFMIGAVFSVDFYINGNAGMNIIPDVLFAVCFLIGSIMIGNKTSKIKIPAVLLSLLYGVVSSVSYYLFYEFNQDHHPLDVSRKPIAFQNWNTLFAVSIIEAILFASTVIVVSLLIYETVKENTGYTPMHETIDPVARASELHKEIRNRITASSVLAVLAATGAVVRVYTFSIYSLAEGSWLIEFAATAIFVTVFILTLYKIKLKAKEKYLFS